MSSYHKATYVLLIGQGNIPEIFPSSPAVSVILTVSIMHPMFASTLGNLSSKWYREEGVLASITIPFLSVIYEKSSETFQKGQQTRKTMEAQGLKNIVLNKIVQIPPVGRLPFTILEQTINSSFNCQNRILLISL